jgi:hypothetical protein
MDPTEMARLLKELLEVVTGIGWKKVVLPESVVAQDPTARSFETHANGWHVTVLSFDIEPQGFPKGSRGYDGMGVKEGVLLRLTRELAERFFKLAESADEANDQPK